MIHGARRSRRQCTPRESSAPGSKKTPPNLRQNSSRAPVGRLILRNSRPKSKVAATSSQAGHGRMGPAASPLPRGRLTDYSSSVILSSVNDETQTAHTAPSTLRDPLRETARTANGGTNNADHLCPAACQTMDLAIWGNRRNGHADSEFRRFASRLAPPRGSPRSPHLRVSFPLNSISSSHQQPSQRRKSSDGAPVTGRSSVWFP